MTDTVTGKIDAISPKPDKSYYGVCIDDEWYNGSPDVPTGIEKGKKVRIEFNESEGFKEIKNISVEETDAQAGGKGASSTSKQQEINTALCFKKAIDQTDRRTVEDEQAYKDMIVQLTKLHMEALEEVKN